ncbi:hypothetical protein H0V99_03505 [Candidatus Saccharibacteria bacterium]|nr:hypothetical protein [Candidatus Saccharibacteria bacterium]
MKKPQVIIFVLLVLGYISLALLLPSDPSVLEKYQITQSQAKMLSLTIVIPFSIIYFSALYGYLRFRLYADSVRRTKEGKHLKELANGLMVLAFYLPIGSIVGSLINYLKFKQPDIVPLTTIFRNYLTLLFAAVALYWIAKGADGLFGTLKNRKINIPATLLLLGPIVLACIYTWLLTTQDSGGIKSAYYLPDWLKVATLAIPYVFVWCIGLKAALHLYIYKDSVKGIVYKRAFDNLAKGIGVIIIISVFVQMITTMNEQLNRLNLTPLLGIVYFLVALYALGYGLVARGSIKLKLIEEV